MKKSDIKLLKDTFGSHRAAAKEIGINERHYIRIRQGKAKGSPLERIAIMFVESLRNQSA